MSLLPLGSQLNLLLELKDLLLATNGPHLLIGRPPHAPLTGPTRKRKAAQPESSWMKRNLTLNALRTTEPVRTPPVFLEYRVKPHPLAPSDVEAVHMAMEETELPANVSSLS